MRKLAPEDCVVELPGRPSGWAGRLRELRETGEVGDGVDGSGVALGSPLLRLSLLRVLPFLWGFLSFEEPYPVSSSKLSRKPPSSLLLS